MIVSIPVGVVVGVTGVEDGDGRVLCEEVSETSLVLPWINNATNATLSIISGGESGWRKWFINY